MSKYENDSEAQKYALGQALRMVKAKHPKLTDRIIEERSGISASTFGRYFRGDREPTLSQLRSLADALDTSVVEIVALAQQLLDEASDQDGSPKASRGADESAVKR